MSLEGLCQICESAPAVDSCQRCGRVVCETHYVEEMGLCTDCASALRDR